MHWHRETEIIRIREGRLRLFIDETEILARAGDLVLLGSGVMHGGEPEECVYDCIVFDPAILMGVEACKRGLGGLTDRTLFMETRTVRGDGTFFTAVEALYARVSGGVVGDELLIMGALFMFFGALAERRNDASLDTLSPRFGRRAEQLKPALEYIESHYGQPITLDELARLSGMSPKYFCRFFKTIVHRSPIDYVNYYRIECASSFLATSDMTVAEIAQHCGYNDSSFFIKQFRRYKGTTPKRYRAVG